MLSSLVRYRLSVHIVTTFCLSFSYMRDCLARVNLTCQFPFYEISRSVSGVHDSIRLVYLSVSFIHVSSEVVYIRTTHSPRVHERRWTFTLR
jgi:hypothetical protein